jgi:SAM-dependent methyltransferase
VNVHPVATGGFASAAPSDVRLRPRYARAAIGRLKVELGTASATVDLSAGTGILTGQLQRAGLTLLALDARAEMLVQLRRSLPTVPALLARGERLPFASASVDAVVVGEAFAAPDPHGVLAEVGRVLRPGGALALSWNDAATGPDERSAHPVRALARLVASAAGFEAVLREQHPNPRPTSVGDTTATVPATELPVTEVRVWRRAV